MPLVEIPLVPGVVKSESPYDSPGRFIDSDKVRFVKARPEKIGGWVKLIDDAANGVPRGLFSWIDLGGTTHVALGTQCKLYVIVGSDALTDVTPFRASGTLTDPFETTDGSAIVTVNDASHGFQSPGEIAFFDGADAVGGITIDGEYTVVEVIDGDTYTIQHSSAATSTAGPGGGSVDYDYEIVCGLTNDLLARGYGVGPYGREAYGTPRTEGAFNLSARYWSLDKYGQNLLALHNDGPLYQWSPVTAGRAALVTNSPTGRFMFVTEERYPFILGADGEAMDVAWPDQADITDWTPTDTNTANVRRLSIGSKLLAGAKLGQGVAMVWSDKAAFLFQYTGSRFVYDSRSVGDNSGIVGSLAFAVAGGVAFWMGNDTFWMFDGAVREIPNAEDIKTFVFGDEATEAESDLSQVQAGKTVCGYNARYSEVWWIYPGREDMEPARYVAVNVKNFTWIVGTLARTSMARFLLGREQPIMTDADGYVYKHEHGRDAEDEAMEASLTMSPSAIQGNDYVLDVWRIIPDFKRRAGDISITIVGYEFPDDPEPDEETVVFEEAMTHRDMPDFHVSGREIGLTLVSNEIGGDFRLGKLRIDISNAGEER